LSSLSSFSSLFVTSFSSFTYLFIFSLSFSAVYTCLYMSSFISVILTIILFCGGGTMVWTKYFVFTKQVFFHLSHTTNPLIIILLNSKTDISSASLSIKFFIVCICWIVEVSYFFHISKLLFWDLLMCTQLVGIFSHLKSFLRIILYVLVGLMYLHISVGTVEGWYAISDHWLGCIT
jgi:hypothetical protein